LEWAPLYAAQRDKREIKLRMRLIQLFASIVLLERFFGMSVVMQFFRRFEYIRIGAALQCIESLFCKVRKRETTLDFCRTCGLVTAETTRQIISTARGLFEAQSFYFAYKAVAEMEILKM
jgi:hypothetical protein